MILSSRRSLLTFFLLVFALSLPFWAAGALMTGQLLPALPISALGFLCPAGAAVILVYRKSCWAGVVALLKRAFDFKRIGRKAWLLPLVFLQPGIMALSFIVMRLTGVSVPFPLFSVWLALALFVVFFIAGLGEELRTRQVEWRHAGVTAADDAPTVAAVTLLLICRRFGVGFAISQSASPEGWRRILTRAGTTT